MANTAASLGMSSPKGKGFSRSVLDSFRQGIRPNIRPNDGSAQNGRLSASSELSSFEDGAANKNTVSSADGGASDAMTAEQVDDGIRYTGGNQSQTARGKINLNGLKKKSAAWAMAAAVVGFIMMALGSTTMAPFAFVNNAMEQFNIMRVSMNKRSTYMMRMQLNPDRNVSLTKATIFSGEKFKISSRLQKKLATRNIGYYEVDSQSGSGKVRLLVYDDIETGEKIPIVADSRDLGKVGSSISTVDGETISFTSSAMTMEDALQNNTNFFVAEESATKTIKGHIVGWFDSLTESFLSRIRTTRNRFFGIKDGDTDEAGTNVKSAAKSGGVAETVGGSEDQGLFEETGEVDEDGNPIIKNADDMGGDAINGSADKTALQNSLSNKAKKAAAAASAAGAVCAGMNVINAFNMAVSALQVAKTINYVTGYLEAIQKTQIGEGGDAMNYYQNQLNQLGDTKAIIDGEEKVVRTNTSATSSAAYNVFFGGPAIKSDDVVGQKFNREYLASNAIKSSGIFNSIIGGTLLSGAMAAAGAEATFQACTAAKATGAAAGLVTDAILFFTSGGIGNGIKALFKGFMNKLVVTTVVTGAAALIGWAVPRVAQFLAMDLIENMVGEDAAYAINSGVSMYMGKAAISNSGAPGTRAAVEAMYQANQEILASDARFDRATLSPFDPSSKYTFVGSLVQQLIPIGNMLSSMSAIRAIGAVTSSLGSSLASIFPGVSASSGETWYDRGLNEDCPSLSAMGLVGDPYCNAIPASDFSTISTDPYEVYLKVGADQFEDEDDANGNPRIKADSDYGKFIVACTLRDSQWGVKDASIQSFVYSSNSTVNSIISGGLGIIPIVGDALDIAESVADESNLKWNTGAACIPDESINPDWKKNKWYQRYTEDQTWLESAGLIEKSAVTAFVEKYYDEHPLDNSLEGVIARYTGMSKEEAENTVGLLEYVDYVAHYDASDKYPLPVTDEKYVPDFNNETALGKGMPNHDMLANIIHYVVYRDLRNRNIVTA